MAPTRNPDRTRNALLEAAYDEIYRVGFRAASLDQILRQSGVTKGALYHHFQNKQALGLAVVEEVLATHSQALWQELATSGTNPLDVLLNGFAAPHADDVGDSWQGCPVNNLVQEMARLDEAFRQALERILEGWRCSIQAALERAQGEGYVRQDLNTHTTAAFLVAAYEGISGLSKCCDTATAQSLAGLVDFVNSLRAAGQTSASAPEAKLAPTDPTSSAGV